MKEFDKDYSSGRDGQPSYWRESSGDLWRPVDQSKAQQKRARKGVGKLTAIAAAAAKQHRGDPHRQVNFILRRADIEAAIGRKRLISQGRHTAIANNAHLCIGELKECGIHLQNFNDFGSKHFMALIRLWEAKGLRESTIQERLCLLRRLLCLIGKPHVVPLGLTLHRLLQQHGIQAGTRGRTYIPKLPIGWRDKGIDVDAVIAKVAALDEVAAVLLELMLRFGLRFSETIQLQPKMSRFESHLFVWRGTKGKKERTIPYSTDPGKRAVQLELLDRAMLIASRRRKGELGWEDLSLEQSKNRMRGLLRAAGISKLELGGTPHGLRHQYATDLFLELTGLPAPVLGKLPRDVYVQNKAAVQAAYLEISRRMGHERPGITQSYGGSVRNLSPWDEFLKILLEKLIAASEAFRQAGVDEAWVTGPYATGEGIDANTLLTVAVAFGQRHAAVDAEVVDDLRRALEAASGLAVRIDVFREIGMPPEGVEVLIRK